MQSNVGVSKNQRPLSASIVLGVGGDGGHTCYVPFGGLFFLETTMYEPQQTCLIRTFVLAKLRPRLCS